MDSKSRIQIGNQDIPLHTFGAGLERTDEAIPLEYLNFSDAPALTQATSPHRHDFYEILFVTEGMGTHFIDFNAYPIEPNTFYFISPGQVHYWETEVPIEGEILIFTDDFLLLAPSDYMVLHELSFFHTVEDTPTLKLNGTTLLQVTSLYQAIAAEFKTNGFRTSSVLRAYIHILLVQIQRICVSQEIEAGNGKTQDKLAQKLTRQFKQLIAKQFVTGTVGARLCKSTWRISQSSKQNGKDDNRVYAWATYSAGGCPGGQALVSAHRFNRKRDWISPFL